MNTQFCAYIHMKPNGEPFYVGKGTSQRASNLNPSLRNAYHKNVVLKYGAENIIIETMICKSENEAFLREKLIIKALRYKGVKLANMTDGGEGFGGGKHSEETLIKMRGRVPTNKGVPCSDAKKAKIRSKLLGHAPPNKGVPHSEETKEKIRAKRALQKIEPAIGHKKSIEGRTKISATHRGNSYRLGIKHTDEAKAKMSASRQNVSVETKNKISASMKGKPWSAARRAAQIKSNSDV